MDRTRRFVVLALLLAALLAVAGPAIATEDSGGGEEETTETTVAPEPTFENGEPAVVIPPSEDVSDDQPWTARFIYPTIVIVTVLLIIGLVIGYNRSIRHKYKVVAE